MAGNIPKFTSFDVLRCLYLIAEHGQEMSRAELVKRLVLGEGTVKSILALLKEKNFVESSQQGHQPTTAGKKFLADLDTLFLRPKKVENDAILDASAISIATCMAPDTDARLDYTLRDEAVKAGAQGALIYQFDNGTFHMPGEEKNEKITSTTKKILKAFQNNTVKEGSALLVSFAEDERGAIWGLFAMVAKINREASRKISELADRS